ncbi:hypothetical protein [Bacillus phage vB_Bpu_PumA2]|uniref:Uncharacterized protein n=1 Tax=Bacillus phage vB_Bpu_PumA2 TaxID=2662128 RepID=A0A5Q2W7T1_9CAUD|nr:hypothetical protein H3021_gp28 [Bacillus phage vB_Bpu_PumA2]QGH74247.1 hypothetical protein [Bacillus phage vB_Bpu_PumA2]
MTNSNEQLLKYYTMLAIDTRKDTILVTLPLKQHKEIAMKLCESNNRISKDNGLDYMNFIIEEKIIRPSGCCTTITQINYYDSQGNETMLFEGGTN